MITSLTGVEFYCTCPTAHLPSPPREWKTESTLWGVRVSTIETASFWSSCWHLTIWSSLLPITSNTITAIFGDIRFCEITTRAYAIQDKVILNCKRAIWGPLISLLFEWRYINAQLQLQLQLINEQKTQKRFGELLWLEAYTRQHNYMRIILLLNYYYYYFKAPLSN